MLLDCLEIRTVIIIEPIKHTTVKNSNSLQFSRDSRNSLFLIDIVNAVYLIKPNIPGKHDNIYKLSTLDSTVLSAINLRNSSSVMILVPSSFAFLFFEDPEDGSLVTR